MGITISSDTLSMFRDTTHAVRRTRKICMCSVCYYARRVISPTLHKLISRFGFSNTTEEEYLLCWRETKGRVPSTKCKLK